MSTRRAYSFLTILSTLLVLVATQGAQASGIVRSIVKAPIVGDGDVSGAITDFVIDLDGSMDPDVPGRALTAGGTIKIFLPRAFVNTAAGAPDEGFGQALATCIPSAFVCSTGVLLQGWPQHPIRPPVLQYEISFDPAAHAVVYTALQNIVPAPPLEPGIKQIHLILNTFLNPRPGQYPIRVESETGPGGALETGVGTLRILPRPRPSINVTSAFNAGTPNTIFQDAAVGAPAPLAWDFLLWDGNADPFLGVRLEPVGRGDDVGGDHDEDGANLWLLRQGRRVVGHIFVDAPDGAAGIGVSSVMESFPINSPVSGLPTARLTIQFVAGSVPGVYRTTLRMNGGNAVTMWVSAQ